MLKTTTEQNQAKSQVLEKEVRAYLTKKHKNTKPPNETVNINELRSYEKSRIKTLVLQNASSLTSFDEILEKCA